MNVRGISTSLNTSLEDGVSGIGIAVNDGNNISGICVYCQTGTAYVCQRCGDFYCSPECQSRDWQRHRYICFPMPALVHSSTFSNTSVFGRTHPIPIYASNTPMRNGLLTNNNNPHHVVQQAKSRYNFNGNLQETSNFMPAAQGIPPRQNYNGQQALNSQEQLLMTSQSDKVQTKQNVNKQKQNKNNNDQKKLQQPQQTKQEQSIRTQTAEQQQEASQMQDILFPKNQSRVILTGFRSPNLCYVRELNSQISSSFFEIIEKINNYGKTAPAMKQQPKVNSLGITKSEDSWVRVQIIANQKNRPLRVLFIDYGTITLRTLDDMREISPEIAVLPLYSCRVKLKNVQNYSISDNLNKWLATYVGNEYKIVYNEETGIHGYVDLYSWETNKHLNAEVSAYCADLKVFDKSDRKNSEDCCGNSPLLSDDVSSATAGEVSIPNQSSIQLESKNEKISPKTKKVVTPPKNVEKLGVMATRLEQAKKKSAVAQENAKPKPVLEPPFKTHQLPITANDLNVFVIDNSNIKHGYIGCIPEQACKVLSAVQDYLDKYKCIEEYTPVLNEYILAKFEGIWFRAKVLDIKKEGHITMFNVIYIDFTNESNLTTKDIRRYPLDLTYDCHTNIGLIEGLPGELDDCQIAYLKDLVESNTILSVNAVKYMDENIASLRCNKIIERFKEDFELK